MPFNASGFFQRLFSWRDDRDAGVKILAERMDQEMDGIVAGINDIVSGNVAWNGSMTGVFGTSAAPAYSFQEDSDTGIYRESTNTLGFSLGGVAVAVLDENGFTVNGSVDATKFNAGGAEYSTTAGGWFLNNWNTDKQKGMALFADNNEMFIKNVTENNPSANPVAPSVLKLWNGSAWKKVLTEDGKAADADRFDGIDSNRYLRYTGWVANPGRDANTQGFNEIGFTYQNNAPKTGPLINMGTDHYSLQLNARYSGQSELSFRTKNGDNQTWNAWKNVLVDGGNATLSDLVIRRSSASSKLLDLRNPQANSWAWINMAAGTDNTGGNKTCHIAFSDRAIAEQPANSLHFRIGSGAADNNTRLAVHNGGVNTVGKLAVTRTATIASANIENGAVVVKGESNSKLGIDSNEIYSSVDLNIGTLQNRISFMKGSTLLGQFNSNGLLTTEYVQANKGFKIGNKMLITGAAGSGAPTGTAIPPIGGLFVRW
ncbi:hypothetical protein VIBNISFn27_500033 [Vibrio nigripulchritudo SFn27]|uniref:Uncharacterized protein n=1 Tax=Vibrio nigripulchritudo TaxID=28173 RepID=U4KFE9_9VIBR|nr:hypothetical protein [Vibrio nigripulchritudo]CCN84553.1 hypothetical protein VIBNIBLFn1_80033 [Vibrio nigripulchritudo BLFn1]CCN88875.1 hypothetical protein VIBNISFn27_500033 [Vibrio nigripulchritudo SFn27]CCN94363.1 hypothetical protein VIBNIENn2_360036 [Vibrio nigripulchritudo ENn2]CCO40210.1 hypothetical protein VIBNISFn135_270033 [Vibrio nigripulchritudo SFn135]CCO51547.1 hypothetical protein VIBNIWn13_1140033 [Vibrio nigripulchritudo Wn13]